MNLTWWWWQILCLLEWVRDSMQDWHGTISKMVPVQLYFLVEIECGYWKEEMKIAGVRGWPCLRQTLSSCWTSFIVPQQRVGDSLELYINKVKILWFAISSGICVLCRCAVLSFDSASAAIDVTVLLKTFRVDITVRLLEPQEDISKYSAVTWNVLCCWMKTWLETRFEWLNFNMGLETRLKISGSDSVLALMIFHYVLCGTTLCSHWVEQVCRCILTYVTKSRYIEQYEQKINVELNKHYN